MSRQVQIWRASASPSSSATRFISPVNGQYWSATEHQGTVPIPAAGEFANWKIYLPSAPTSGKSLTFTLRVNQVDTAAVITIQDAQTEGEWTDTPIAIADGDELSFRCVPSGTPVVSTPHMSWDFIPTTSGQAVYGMGNVNGPVAITRTNRLLSAVDVTNWTAPNTRNITSIDATISKLTVKIDVDPGGGGNWTFVINKNGTAQDGTGGTPDTRIVFTTGGGLKLSSTFSLDVAPNDHFSLSAQDGGGANIRPIFGVRMTADDTTLTHFGGVEEGNLDAAATEYMRPCQGSDLSPGTEGNNEVKVGITGFTLRTMRVRLNDTPGTGNDYTFTLRKNVGDTTAVVTINDLETSDVSANEASFVEGDTLALRVVPTSTPNVRNAGWAWGQFVEEAEVSVQRVTQVFVEVAVDEDQEDDPPADIADCTGGGTVSTGTNPAAGTSLATTTAPICWMELTLNDGSPATVYRWAAGGVNLGEPKQARVLEFGKVTRALSDPDGGPEAATISTLLADVDGTIRALWVSGTLRHAAVEYYISDLATLQASGVPWRVFRGFVSECQPEGDRRFRLISEDVLTARLNSIDAQDLQTPRLLIDETQADLGPDEQMFGRAVPDIYGSISNETGAWECYYIGTTPAPGEDTALAWFLVGAGVLGIQEVFVGGLGATPVSRIQLQESAFGGPWYAPGKTGWIEPNDWSIRDGRRYTFIAGSLTAPSVRLAKEGTIPLLANVCGYDTVGNRSGSPVETINGPARALLHWLNNRVAQDATGNWLDIAEHGAFSLFDTTTFEDVQALFDAASPVMTCDGAVGGDYQQHSWRDRVAEFCRSFAYDFGTNRHGQGILVKLDRSDLASSATLFGPEKILASSVRVDLRASACENEVRYVFRRNYVTTLPFLAPNTNSRLPKDPYRGEWESGLLTIQDTASITALGGGTTGLRRSQVQELTLVRDDATALATATERLDLFSPPNGRCEGSFDLTLKHGAAVELGAIVKAEHWDLPWTGSRRCQVRRHETDLDVLIVTIGFRDVDDLLP